MNRKLKVCCLGLAVLLPACLTLVLNRATPLLDGDTSPAQVH
jgi:hypothetical protein